MVLEYRVNWNGLPGGPGLSVFHGRTNDLNTDQEAAEDLVGKVRAMFDLLDSVFPTQISWSFPDEVTELNTTTGILEDVYAVEGGANISGIVSGGWAAPAGVRVRWTTPAIVAGKRLTGSTFLVPVAAALYQNDGTILADSLTQLNAAVEDYYSEGVFDGVNAAVWSRTHGVVADITGHTIPDKVSILTSRRD